MIKITQYQIGNSDLAQRMENDAMGRAIYIGEAKAGTADGATKWRIRKLAYGTSSATSVKWASGTAEFDKEWDERTSYTYS